MLEGDPAALVGTPKREQRLPGAPGEAEMSQLLEMPDTSQPLGRRDRAILELFYASGLRLSELVGLDLDDVNLSGRVVRVLGKGRQGADRAVQPHDRGRAAGLAGAIASRCRGRRDAEPRHADAARIDTGGSRHEIDEPRIPDRGSRARRPSRCF